MKIISNIKWNNYFRDDSCIIQLEKTPDSVFKILPMTQYTAKKALRERNKRRSAFQLLSSMNQPTPQESEKDEELSQLEVNSIVIFKNRFSFH